jgi:MFS family permease
MQHHTNTYLRRQTNTHLRHQPDTQPPVPVPTAGAPMTPTSPKIKRWRAFALLAVAFFMTIIDLTIVNVALPTIGRDLHFSATSLQWVVTAYALTFGGFMLLGGRAADLLGRRRILMVGLALFTGASLAAALSTGEVSLIAARAVQGLGGAIMLPAALSIVMNMFEEGAERNKALGIWGGLGAGGATVGVIAGGRGGPRPLRYWRPPPIGRPLSIRSRAGKSRI